MKERPAAFSSGSAMSRIWKFMKTVPQCCGPHADRSLPWVRKSSLANGYHILIKRRTATVGRQLKIRPMCRRSLKFLSFWHYNKHVYKAVLMLELKLRAVGTSTGVVLPKEMLARLRTKQGEVLYAVETPTGYVLTSLDPRVKEQVESGEAFMDRYRDVFAALAK